MKLYGVNLVGLKWDSHVFLAIVHENSGYLILFVERIVNVAGLV